MAHLGKSAILLNKLQLNCEAVMNQVELKQNTPHCFLKYSSYVPLVLHKRPGCDAFPARLPSVFVSHALIHQFTSLSL